MSKLYCKSGGCSAKLAAGSLEKILNLLPKYEDENLLVGFDGHDDGAVYKINEETAIISTLDFFPPLCEDPYTFGAIAAANACSDVYAMGGRVLTALNIVCFPEEEDFNVLGEIMRGGSDKLHEAGGILAGGHSILDPEIKYGLAVTGIVHPDKIWKNNTPEAEDVLLLTKKLGTGLVMAAKKAGDVKESDYHQALESMQFLNKTACEILQHHTVHAVSDVTGFGLLIHTREMMGPDHTAILQADAIPCFDGVPYYIEEFYLTAAAQRNRNAMQNDVHFEEVDFILQELLYDPQTSGGLLIAADKSEAEKIQKDLHEAGVGCWQIGSVEKRKDKSVIVKGKRHE